ncbi:MAG: hypothetical protein JXA03_10730 [Bacteroidales bacterium]|nr:hypothetical protein [Bacteroidales bacterium]
MSEQEKINGLFETLVTKGRLKQLVYRNTHNALNLLKETMKEFSGQYEQHKNGNGIEIPFIFNDRGEFEAELKFAGDTLMFMMHTNVFEFSRDHEVMKTSYIREDKNRSYCGIINIFNFLSDSFKYNRLNDIGYLIGRIFINRDNHYFVEGKREIGFLYSNFGDSVLNPSTASEIIRSAILYTINFDLLTPPYDSLKEVTVQEFNSVLDSMQIKTGKRLGFRFQADPA